MFTDFGVGLLLLVPLAPDAVAGVAEGARARHSLLRDPVVLSQHLAVLSRGMPADEDVLFAGLAAEAAEGVAEDG